MTTLQADDELMGAVARTAKHTRRQRRTLIAICKRRNQEKGGRSGERSSSSKGHAPRFACRPSPASLPTASPPTPLYLSLSEIPTLLSRLPFPQTPTPRRPDLPLPHLQLPLRPRALGHRAARTRRRRRDARAMLLVMQRQI